MIPCFRIEIVVETPRAVQMTKLLDALDVAGYTQVPDVCGAGDRGRRSGDDLIGDTNNCLFIIVCKEREMVDAIVDAARPLIEKGGGICLVSEVEGLI